MITIKEIQDQGMPAPEIRPDYQLNELVAVVDPGLEIYEGDVIECVPGQKFFPETDVHWKFIITEIGPVFKESPRFRQTNYFSDPLPETEPPGGDSGNVAAIGSGKKKRQALRGLLLIPSAMLDKSSQSAALYPNTRKV